MPADVGSGLASNQTPGLVCAHHHLYSALARGMPAPPRTPSGFVEILEMVWWRLDRALDLESIRWSAMLGALEAPERGCTAVIDHHESPHANAGSLRVMARSCAEAGARVSRAAGVEFSVVCGPCYLGIPREMREAEVSIENGVMPQPGT